MWNTISNNLGEIAQYGKIKLFKCEGFNRGALIAILFTAGLSGT
jgi:hypothetical protein